MLHKLLIGILLITFSLSLQAQEKTLFNEIQFYADITANTGLAASRIYGNEQLEKSLEKWLSSSSFSSSSLDSLQYISVKSPSDKSFSIITWQLINEDNSHTYYGFIRTQSGKIIKLNAENNINKKDIVYEILDASNWYGALYYNMLPTKLENGLEAYLLFGYDGYKGFEHRKIVDVLYFENDKPYFGFELFKKQVSNERDQLFTRLFLEYSKDANVSLNYNDGLSMITHDHLITRMGNLKRQGLTQVPDGSYVGYKWDGTHWNHIEKLYNQISSRPPSANKKERKSKHIYKRN